MFLSVHFSPSNLFIQLSPLLLLFQFKSGYWFILWSLMKMIRDFNMHFIKDHSNPKFISMQHSHYTKTSFFNFLKQGWASLFEQHYRVLYIIMKTFKELGILYLNLKLSLLLLICGTEADLWYFYSGEFIEIYFVIYSILIKTSRDHMNFLWMCKNISRV